MAYMNQEKKAVIKANLDKALKGTGVKCSLSVSNHTAICCTIKSAPIDLIANMNEVCRVAPGANRYGTYQDAKDYVQINPYWYQEHFTGNAYKFLSELFSAMNVGNHDRSDIQTDYFDVGWYVDVNIGDWNKPYTVIS